MQFCSRSSISGVWVGRHGAPSIRASCRSTGQNSLPNHFHFSCTLFFLLPLSIHTMVISIVPPFCTLLFPLPLFFPSLFSSTPGQFTGPTHLFPLHSHCYVNELTSIPSQRHTFSWAAGEWPGRCSHAGNHYYTKKPIQEPELKQNLGSSH